MGKVKVTRKKKRTVVKRKVVQAPKKAQKAASARKAKSAAAKSVPKKAARSKAVAKSGQSKAKKTVSLGRPKVVGDEKLYLLFKDDYHARQIFEFLRVETVKELEQFTPQEIVDRLSAPLVITVQRIRRFLATQNRALAGDQEFAAQHKASAR